MKPENDSHYAGKDVRLGTPDRPILWVERKRDGRCMVVYADLSVKELAAEGIRDFPEAAGPE